MKKILSMFVGFLLVITLMSSVMAISNPTINKPQLKNFYDETNVVFQPFLSVLVDKETINLGESTTFTLDLTTIIPDSDYSDGTLETQFAGWVFADEDGKVINSKEFSRIYQGSFSDTIVVKPMVAGEYALVGLIIQIDQTYDSVTSQWITSPEEVVVKEAQKLNVILPAPPIGQPSIGNWIANIWGSVMDWFSGLFG